MSVRNRWRIKVQKLNQWISRLDRSSSRIATREKATCGAHDWKMKSHVRLSILRLSCEKGQPVKDMRKFMFGKKLCFVLPNLYPHYIYSHYPQIVKSAFQRENPSKYTWEFKIVIPTIIYTFPCGFPQTPTSPSQDPWEVVSLKTYHTHSEC